MPLVKRETEAIATGPEVVKKIDALLTEEGIPKMKFYKDCKITAGAYSQWRAGLTTPTLNTLDRIARYLGVQTADLAFTSKETHKGVIRDRVRVANTRSTTSKKEKPALTIEGEPLDAQKELYSLIPELTVEEVNVLVAAARAQVAARRGRDSD